MLYTWTVQTGKFLLSQSSHVPTASVCEGYTIGELAGEQEWMISVESAFITSKYTNFFLSLTNVMVQGVSLNNPTAAVCDFKSSAWKGTTRKGKLGGHRLSCSVQYFNTFNTSVKRIIKQQGHGSCLNLTALFPPSSSQGRGQNMQKKFHLETNYQTKLN